jgi:uncharacterized coiled-coil DUF342 family protein
MPKPFAVESEAHAGALRDRDRFLAEHPELAHLQKEIDDKLEKAESNHNRLVMISNLMMESFMKMDARLQDLRRNRKRRITGSAD